MATMKLVLLCYHLIATAVLVYANKPNTDLTNSHFDARVSQMLAKNVLQLSQEIGTTILQDSDRSAEVISPLSIYLALSILLMGSNGPTFYELLNILKINGKLYLNYGKLFSTIVTVSYHIL